MNYSFIHSTDSFVLSLLIFTGMILLVKLGSFLAHRRQLREAADLQGSSGSLLAALFGLFGFILAFTFGMSGNRYENSRNVITEEANDIGTAILRSDLYPDSIRAAFRQDFKIYLEARILYFEHFSETASVRHSKEAAAVAGQRLWDRACGQARMPGMLVPSNLMIPALNNMFDIATKREILILTPVPDIIVWMLLILALATSFIGGLTVREMHRKDWIVVFTFALLSSMIIFITLDLGRPMRGVIKVDVSEQAIIALRKMF